MREHSAYFDAIAGSIDLSLPPPEKEPQRQYYFMASLRQINQEFMSSNGRRRTMHIETYGCQANARDSETYAGILENCGYESVDTEDADLVLYNTCSVRENANMRVYGHLGQMKKTKKGHPGMLIFLCGCMMQEPEVID